MAGQGGQNKTIKNRLPLQVQQGRGMTIPNIRVVT